MKKGKFLKFLFGLLIMTLIFSIANKNISNNGSDIIQKNNEKYIKRLFEEKLYNNAYDSTLNYIRWHEGYSDVVYHTGVDTDGPTIGYGHLIKRTDKIPMKIDKNFADSLLVKDFNMAMDAAKRLSPQLNEWENRYKLLAISHFIYAKGSGNYQKSQLRKLVNSDITIKHEIIKWNVIYVDSVRYENKRMLKNRKWEIEMYNRIVY